MSADRRDPAIEPREQADRGGGDRGEWRPPRVEPELQHPKPPRDKEDAGAGRDAEADRFQQALELSGREGFLHSVTVEPDEVQHVDHERPEERVELVRHADDRDPTGPENTEDLPRGLRVLLEVLDRAHRVDYVDRGVTERNRPHVADGEARLMIAQDL